MIDISKGCKSNPALTSYEPGQMTCLIRGSGRPKVSNQLTSLIHFDAELHTYTAFIARLSKLRL